MKGSDSESTSTRFSAASCADGAAVAAVRADAEKAEAAGRNDTELGFWSEEIGFWRGLKAREDGNRGRVRRASIRPNKD